MHLALHADHDLVLEVLREDRERGWVGPTSPSGWTVCLASDSWAANLDGSVPFLTVRGPATLVLATGVDEVREWTHGTDPRPWAEAAAQTFGVPVDQVAAALQRAQITPESIFAEVGSALGLPEAAAATMRRGVTLVPSNPDLARAMARGFAPALLLPPQDRWSAVVPRGTGTVTATSLAQAAARLSPTGDWAVALERTGPSCELSVATADVGARAATFPMPGWTPLVPTQLTMADQERVRSVLRISNRPDDAEALLRRLTERGRDLDPVGEMVSAGFLPDLAVLSIPEPELERRGESFAKADGKALAAYDKQLKARDRQAQAVANPRESTSTNFRHVLGTVLRMRSLLYAVLGLVAVVTGIGLIATGHHHTGQSGVRGTPIGLILIGSLGLLRGVTHAFRH